jgi:hypothetical protein
MRERIVQAALGERDRGSTPFRDRARSRSRPEQTPPRRSARSRHAGVAGATSIEQVAVEPVGRLVGVTRGSGSSEARVKPHLASVRCRRGPRAEGHRDQRRAGQALGVLERHAAGLGAIEIARGRG